MKGKKSKFRSGIRCFIIILLFTVASCGQRGEKGDKEPAVPVAVAVVRKGSISNVLSLTGNISAAYAVDLYSKVPGRLEDLKKDVGDKVRKGEVVATIDDEDITARLNQAKADLAVAEASLKKAQADLHKAGRDRDRAAKLYERGVESETLFDQADTAHKAALAAQELAESNVSKGEAYLDQATILLDETRIESPLNGFVAKKFVDAGAMITLSTPILKVVHIDTVDVVVSMPEVKLSAVAIGSPAEVRVDAYPQDRFSGTVARISPWVDLKTRTTEVEVVIENKDHHLKPGMFTRVTLKLEEHEGVPLISKDAILLVGGDIAVYAIEDGVARVKKVRTGLEQGNLVEVIDGLEGGERIIVRGQSVVADGSTVEVVREEEIL